ncbi:hypothetical protein KJ665_04155 [Patescibacteria group bacterium]|nr:hypothetical protein [Patescibacteria group bacterium]
MKLEELFLGRERVLTVKGEKLKVRQLPGTDIFIATDGSFVMPRWQGKEEGQTPHQRAQKKWSTKELRYVVYSQGLSVALRSRQLALFQAEKIACPTYKKALTVFLEEVRSAIISNETMDFQKMSPVLRHKLQTFGFVFQRAQKTGVQEAMVKILFLYQDGADGLNVGAMLARTVAITDRLRERLLGMYGWVRKYQAQEGALKIIFSMVQETISQVSTQMNKLRQDSALIWGEGNKRSQRLVADRLTTLSISLEPLKLIQPFSRWTTFVIKDFDEMFQATKDQDFVLTRALIERILFSIGLKNVQVSLDRLLLRLGQETIIKKFNWHDYASWTGTLAARLDGLVAHEARVGLREKVCRVAALALHVASQEASTGCRLKHFKAAVKRAYAVL